jgi:AraC-like DNA-binding protein
LDKINIKRHSINDTLKALGDIPQSEGLHIYLNKDEIFESPFPYPFRSESYTILLIVSGGMTMQFNLLKYNLQTADMVVISPQTITHILEIENSVTIIGVSFTLNFALNNSINKNEMDAFDFFASKTVPYFKLKNEEVSSILNLTELLHKKNTQINPFFGKELLKHSFNLFMYEIASIYRKNFSEIKTKMTRKEELTSKFYKLLEENFIKERKVQFYSDALFMTAGHLSKTLKEVSGKTTGELIDAVVITEACILLSNPSLSIAQIAEELNFSDQSFFGKFFKKHMQLSPSEYRKKR